MRIESLPHHIFRFWVAAIYACTFLISAGSQAQNARITNLKPRPHQSGPNTIPAVASDPEAIAALQAVLANSGGQSAWQATSSMKQSFAMTDQATSAKHVFAFLDDWSQPTSRYRRHESGSGATPKNHNGQDSFKVKIRGLSRTLPEFDQARLIASRLPAAAAEILLRRKEYVLKTSSASRCEKTSTCIDVLRQLGSGQSAQVEEQWEIDKASGRPLKVSVLLPAFGTKDMTLWKSTRFIKFDTRDGLVIPTEIAITHPGGSVQHWSLVSAKANPGFDVQGFDQEALSE